MEEYKLSELLEIKYGKDHKSLSDGKIPCYGTGGLMRYVDKFLYDEESILIPRKGSLENLYYINRPFWTVDTLFWSKINKDLVIPKFLFYKLKTLNFSNLNEGSAIPSLTTKTLNQIIVNIPDLETQKKIASILSDLDDKIELNNEMNKTLEEMAQTLFKRWFIDFDFPNENGEPYRSSGGKMVDSELGEIPEGWEIGKIGDLIRVQNGYAFKSKDFLEKGTIGIIKIKNISDRKVDINKSDFISEELAEAIDKKFFIQSSSILIAMTGAEVGKVGIVPEHNKKLYLNQRVGKFEELISGGKEFSYFYLNKEETQELIIAKSAGSAQPNISSKGIEELKIVLPSIKLLSEFEKNIGKSLKKIALNLNEINILTEIRDTLLPKLMSGEIDM